MMYSTDGLSDWLTLTLGVVAALLTLVAFVCERIWLLKMKEANKDFDIE